MWYFQLPVVSTALSAMAWLSNWDACRWCFLHHLVMFLNQVVVLELILFAQIKRLLSTLSCYWVQQQNDSISQDSPGTWIFRYPKDFFEKDLAEFDRPETAVLPLPRLYLQAKQLALDLAARDGLQIEVTWDEKLEGVVPVVPGWQVSWMS